MPRSMEPYYEDECATIFHGRCEDVMSNLPTHSVDVVLTDPPFFMPATHYQSRVEWQRAWSDTSVLASFWRGVVDNSVRLLRTTGHMMAFCNGDSFAVFYPEMYRRFDFLASLVWDKGQVGLGRVWRHQHEFIIAARWSDSTFNDDGVLRSDIIKARATRSSDRTHPVEKPTELLRMLLEPVVPPGGVVLDPFMGSGTTLEAAKQLGCKSIGIDGEERYCEIAAERLSQGVLSLGDTDAA